MTTKKIIDLNMKLSGESLYGVPGLHAIVARDESMGHLTAIPAVTESGRHVLVVTDYALSTDIRTKVETVLTTNGSFVSLVEQQGNTSTQAAAYTASYKLQTLLSSIAAVLLGEGFTGDRLGARWFSKKVEALTARNIDVPAKGGVLAEGIERGIRAQNELVRLGLSVKLGEVRLESTNTYTMLKSKDSLGYPLPFFTSKMSLSAQKLAESNVAEMLTPSGGSLANINMGSDYINDMGNINHVDVRAFLPSHRIEVHWRNDSGAAVPYPVDQAHQLERELGRRFSGISISLVQGSSLQASFEGELSSELANRVVNFIHNFLVSKHKLQTSIKIIESYGPIGEGLDQYFVRMTFEDEHEHTAILDKDGNGLTNPGPNDGHMHEVVGWVVMPAGDDVHEHTILDKKALSVDTENVEITMKLVGQGDHWHFVSLDANGDGMSSPANDEEGGHQHKVAGFAVLEAEGHRHDLASTQDQLNLKGSDSPYPTPGVATDRMAERVQHAAREALVSRFEDSLYRCTATSYGDRIMIEYAVFVPETFINMILENEIPVFDKTEGLNSTKTIKVQVKNVINEDDFNTINAQVRNSAVALKAYLSDTTKNNKDTRVIYFDVPVVRGVPLESANDLQARVSYLEKILDSFEIESMEDDGNKSLQLKDLEDSVSGIGGTEEIKFNPIQEVNASDFAISRKIITIENKNPELVLGKPSSRGEWYFEAKNDGHVLVIGKNEEATIAGYLVKAGYSENKDTSEEVKNLINIL